MQKVVNVYSLDGSGFGRSGRLCCSRSGRSWSNCRWFHGWRRCWCGSFGSFNRFRSRCGSGGWRSWLRGGRSWSHGWCGWLCGGWRGGLCLAGLFHGWSCCRSGGWLDFNSRCRWFGRSCGSRRLSEDFLAAVARLALGCENSQGNGEDEKKHRQVDSAFLQHIGGLRAHQLGHGTVTKRRAEAFLPRALHENDKNHEEADENFDHREYANQNVHRGREYGGRPSFGKRHLISTPEGGFLPCFQAR